MKLLSTLAITLALTTPIHAADLSCGDALTAYENLASQHGQSRISMGLSGGKMVETWANRKTGAWTMLITRPDGITCVVVVGTDFMFVPKANA